MSLLRYDDTSHDNNSHEDSNSDDEDYTININGKT